MFPTAGIGLKAQHIDYALASLAAGIWFEVHAENYMVAGGPRLAMLEEVRSRRPLSIHGVGLSLASPFLPDASHLSKLKQLIDRFEPFLVSEHLAWSRIGSRSLPDLLPFPRSKEALECVCRNIDHVQAHLQRQILIENPSHYFALEGHVWSEQAFLAQVARRTGCGLLLDLNNVHVSAANIGFDAREYFDDFPAENVDEIHLAGAMPDAELGLLVDNHGSAIAAPVWALLDTFVDRHGPRPTLIEWDRNLPEYKTLLEERDKAAAMLSQYTMGELKCLT